MFSLKTRLLIMSTMCGWLLGGVALGWSNPSVVVDTSYDSLEPRLVIDSNEDIHVVWRERVSGSTFQIWYTNDSTGSFATPTEISQGTSYHCYRPDIATDGSDVAAVWYSDQNDNFEAFYTKRSSGSWGSIYNASDTEIKSLRPCVEFASGVDPIVTWDEAVWGSDNYDIYYSEWDTSDFTTAANLSSTANGQVYGSVESNMAIDSSDDVTVVWPDRISGTYHINAKRRVNDSWGSRAEISSIKVGPQQPGVDTGPDDEVWVAYFHDGEGDWAIYVQEYDGSWQTETKLSQTISYPTRPKCAVDSNGNLHVVCDAVAADNKRDIFYTTNENGSWSAWANISQTSNANSLYPEIEVEDDTLVVVWEDESNGSGGTTDYEAWYTKRAIVTGPSGTISGTVKDSNNENLAGVTVSISDDIETTSASDGTYTLTPVPTGTHTVTGSKTYYTSDTEEDVSVTEDNTTVVNLTLTGSAPNAITNLAVTGFPERIKLTWTNPGSGNHTGTRIMYSTSDYPSGPSNGTLVGEVSSGVAELTHYGLDNNTTYYYSAFSYFEDASRYYASGDEESGSPSAGPKANLLSNGSIDNIVNDVATDWTYYENNDPSSGIYPCEDFANYVTSPAQGIFALGSSNLPGSGYTSAGLYQVVSSLTSGKIYQFIAYQDIYNSNYSAAGHRYVLNFGIDPEGGTSQGSPTFDGLMGDVEWMTSDQALYNDNAGSPVWYSGLHKSWAAVEADSTSVSVWTGLTINNTGTKDAVATKFDTDLAWLFEWDLTANASLQNGNFEGNVIDLQNYDADWDNNDTIPDEWVPAGGSCGEWSSLLCEDWGARTGELGVRVANRRGTINGGLMQRVSCTQSKDQNFTAYVKTSGEDSTVGSIGIDPYGGADINSSNIVWKSTTNSSWTQLQVSAVAQASQITVFLRSKNTNSATGEFHYSYFDDCSLSEETPETGTISGTVTDSCSNAIEGATVETDSGGYSDTTDANGDYTLSSVLTGTYTVTATKTGFDPVSEENVTVTKDQTTDTDLVFTNNLGAIDGYVKDESNDPIQGATVTTDTGGHNDTTDSNGYYLLSDVTAGVYDVTVTVEGYVNETQTDKTVTACQTLEVNFSLEESCETEVIDYGDMEGGFWSTGWGGGSAIPNGWDGWYQPNTDFNCYDETTTVHGDSHSAKTTISSGGDSGSGGYKRGIYQNVYVGAYADFTFTVWAQHDNGNCPSIMCWNPGQDSSSPETAYSNGRYQWVTTDNWGDLDTWVSRSMEGTAGSGGWITIIVGGAHHGGGGAAIVYVDDVSVISDCCDLSEGAISGTVTDSSSNAIQGATVETDTGGYSTTTDSNGDYTLSNVEAGTYDVTASKDGYESDTETDVMVTAGQTSDVDFTLSEESTEKLENGDMEGGFWSTGWGGGSAIPNDWDGWYQPGTDFNCYDATVIKHGGSHSAKTTISSGGDAGSGGYKRGIYQNVYVGANADFTITVWARHTNGNCPSIMCWNPGQDSSSPELAADNGRYKWITVDNWGELNTWVSNTLEGKSAPSSGWITVIVGGAHHGGSGIGTVYIDDCSVTTP